MKPLCPHHADLLQAWLDGQPLKADLLACEECRQWVVCGQKLKAVLPRPVPTLTLDFAAETARLALLERRRRLIRNWSVAAVAASLLLGGTWLAWPPTDAPILEPVVAHVSPSTPVEPPTVSIRANIEQASQVVVALASRSAETVPDPTRLMPTVPTEMLVGNPMLPMPWPSGLEPAVQSLSEAGQVAADGLEPVARSAQRAFRLFMRESSGHADATSSP